MTEYSPDKVFLPYQQELLGTTAISSVTVVEKSRRTGYSWAAAAIAVLEAGREESPQSVYYMGYDYEMAREFIAYVGEWAKKFEQTVSDIEESVFQDPDNPDKDIKTFRVSFANGKEVVALPSVARALRGKQGFVIIDEAAFHDDLKEVLKSAFALLIWGGKVLIISTHNGDDNPFNELIQEIRADKKPYKLLRCTFDDAMEQGLYKRICQKQGTPWTLENENKWRKDIYDFYGESAEEELDCIPSNGSGTYLPRIIIEKCMRPEIPVVSYELASDFAALTPDMRENIVNDWIEENLNPLLDRLNPHLQSGMGFDFARSSDLSVAWICQENQDLTLTTAFVLEIRNIPHEQQKQIVFHIMSRLPRLKFTAFDARGNGSYVAEVAWQKYGDSQVEQVMLTTEWYRQNMPKGKAYLEDGSITIPKNANILNDFKQVKVVKGVACIPNVRTKDERGNKRHGDSFIAYILAVYAMKKDNIPVYDGYMSIKDLDDGIEDRSFRKKGCW